MHESGGGPTNQIKLLCDWQLSNQNKGEEIIGIQFIENHDPTFIIVLTRQQNLKKSRIYIIKLQRNGEKYQPLVPPPRSSEQPTSEQTMMVKKCDSFTSQERDFIHDMTSSVKSTMYRLQI
jgi:hypothetical protein